MRAVGMDANAAGMGKVMGVAAQVVAPVDDDDIPSSVDQLAGDLPFAFLDFDVWASVIGTSPNPEV